MGSGEMLELQNTIIKDKKTEVMPKFQINSYERLITLCDMSSCF